ncbi:MAG: SLC13 family permease [Chromatiales bacterium]|jgi:di/tricarboxylate transporter
MPGETLFVFGLIVAAAVAMASNRIRYDIVALLVVLALMLSGVLTVGQSLAGFGSVVVILVAGLLIIGEMLARTGVASAVGDWILKKGGTSETRLLVVIMVAAALLGSVMSSTAIVAIFIPIVLRVAAEAKLSPSRILIPLSYAALISGMLTLIATPANIVVNEELKEAGFGGFGFFGFALVGLMVLVVAIAYMLLIGRRLLPGNVEEPPVSGRRRRVEELSQDFGIRGELTKLRVKPDSPLAGATLAQSKVKSDYDLRVLGVLRRTQRSENRIPAPGPDLEIHPLDELLIIGASADCDRLADDKLLTRIPITAGSRQRWLWEAGGATVMLHPDSRLIGKSLVESEFRSHYDVDVLGMRRDQEPVQDYPNTDLMASDSLFVFGPWPKIRQLQALSHDFIVTELPAELAEIVPEYRRMPTALAILGGMVGLAIFDIVPLVAAVIMAVLAAIFTRCLTMEDAYRAIPWSSIVLVAGMLPLADALQQTGGSDIIVNTLMEAVGDAAPDVMLSCLFFLTAGLGLFLSNTASAVLVAPIAIAAAAKLSISPYPFAIAVLIASSAAFVTPFSTPVVALVVEPGRYKFIDFVKTGVPLLLLAFVVTLVTAPLLFPYGG